MSVRLAVCAALLAVLVATILAYGGDAPSAATNIKAEVDEHDILAVGNDDDDDDDDDGDGNRRVHHARRMAPRPHDTYGIYGVYGNDADKSTAASAAATGTATRTAAKRSRRRTKRAISRSRSGSDSRGGNAFGSDGNGGSGGDTSDLLAYSSNPSVAIDEMRADLTALVAGLLRLQRGDVEDRDGNVVATVSNIPAALAAPLRDVATAAEELQGMLDGGGDVSAGSKVQLPSLHTLSHLDALLAKIAALPSPVGVETRVIERTGSAIDYFYMIVTQRVVDGRMVLKRALQLVHLLITEQATLKE